MKILDTDNFISERVKVKPVTNAEWYKIKKDAKPSLLSDYNICRFVEPPINPASLAYGCEYGVVIGKEIVMQHGRWLTSLYDSQLRHKFNDKANIIEVYEPDYQTMLEIKHTVHGNPYFTTERLKYLASKCTLVWKAQIPLHKYYVKDLTFKGGI